MAPSTGAGFLAAGAEDELLEPLPVRLRSASSTACFLATSAAILAWRARARASAASRATRSFSLSIWCARLSNGDAAGAFFGFAEPSSPEASSSTASASRWARSAARKARSISTASRRARSSSAFLRSASACSSASLAASSSSSLPARCLISGSRFLRILAT
ncbi:MAG: hypothetical protein ACLSVD_08120 [Eggerthellaceae bacterium]